MIALELDLQEHFAPREPVMKCLECGSPLTTHRENVPHEPPGTVLVDAPVKRCTKCDFHGVGIERYDELDAVISQEVLRKPGRLGGGEIRYLRSCLQLSAAELAKLIATDPATISRWETDKQQIGHQTDLLLRALVLLYADGAGYPIAQFAEMGGDKVSPSKYVFKRVGAKWQRVASPTAKESSVSAAWKKAAKPRSRSAAAKKLAG